MQYFYYDEFFAGKDKNSPNSLAKLEQKDGLKNLIDDVLKYLIANLRSTEVGNIILAGHSGAYRVISFCLMRAVNTKISDVIFFDALYGQTEKYAHWIDLMEGFIKFIRIKVEQSIYMKRHLMMCKNILMPGNSILQTDEIN